jgi:3-oxoadipate enol-lactonase
MKRETGRLERPGCSIHYEVTGEGPALVFAHGLGGNHMSWWQQVGHFSPRFRCVTFSHRGFWPSSAIPGGPDPDDYAGDLAALVDHLGIESFVLIAQSMGGWTAVEYAQLRTGKLRGIVMAATGGSIARDKLGDPAALAAWEAASAATKQALAAAGGHQATGLRMLAEQPAMALLYQHVDEANAGLAKEALRARMNGMRRRPPEDLIAAGCPILLIANEEDVVMPPFASAAIARVVPGASAAMIGKAGHSAYFERPAEFNALVEGFLAGL